MILKNLKTGVSRIEFELDKEESAAIGRVTAHWAYLEHAVYSASKGISTAVGIDLPQDALSTSFKRRLTALRLLVEEFAPDQERKRMLSLVGKIANAEQDRHRVTHGLWEWDKANPERIAASSFRPGFEFEKLFDTRKLHDLADRIGEASFSLEHPDGWEAGLKETLRSDDDSVAFFHVSRQLARAWTSRKAPAPPESEEAIEYLTRPGSHRE